MSVFFFIAFCHKNLINRKKEENWWNTFIYPYTFIFIFQENKSTKHTGWAAHTKQTGFIINKQEGVNQGMNLKAANLECALDTVVTGDFTTGHCVIKPRWAGITTLFSAFNIRMQLGLLTTGGTKVKVIHLLECVWCWHQKKKKHRFNVSFKTYMQLQCIRRFLGRTMSSGTNHNKHEDVKFVNVNVIVDVKYVFTVNQLKFSFYLCIL